MDNVTQIIVAACPVIAAILGVVGAYIGIKKKKSKGDGSVNNDSSIQNAKAKGDIINAVDKSTHIHVHGNTSDSNQKSTQTKAENHEVKNQSDAENIHLSEKYTSIFAEDNKLKTEQIHITKQKGGNIEGIVTLVENDGTSTETHTYTLKGKYLNKILTAEYYSQNGMIDERGAINLKLIDKEILSGFCSFSKVATSDDEIRVSPYVWVVGENRDLIDGTFDFCTKCHEDHKVCCCASTNVDMPVFLNSELNLIRNQLVRANTEKNSFSKSLSAPYQDSPVRQMKRDEKKNKEKDEIEYTRCYFYDLEQQKCKIYNGRPIDCRLFPYDIKVSSSNEYIVGYYTDLCDRHLPDESIMKKKAHVLRPYFFLMYPYLHIITSDEVCTRLKNAEFKEIAKFRDFVF